MLTQKKQDDGTVEFKVMHFIFNIEDKENLEPENCQIKQETKLELDSKDYQLENKEIADFKFCEGSGQIRLVLKRIDEREFEIFCFDSSDGTMNLYLPFNKDTAPVPEQSKQLPIAWVWLSDSESLVVKDRREISSMEYTDYISEYEKLKMYNDFSVK